MAHILVHLDTGKGLEENITPHWRHFLHCQNPNYEGMHFQCKRCHKVGRLFKDCPLLTPTSQVATRGIKHCQPEDSIVDEQPSGQNHSKDADGVTAQPTSALLIPPISPPLTRSWFAVEAAPTTGTTPPSFPSALHFNRINASLIQYASLSCMNTTINCELERFRMILGLTNIHSD